MSNSHVEWEPLPPTSGQHVEVRHAGVAATPQHRLGGFALDIGLAIVTFGIGWFIWSLVIWAEGLTPAKQILKMRVIASETGRKATWGHMAIREFCLPLAFSIALIPLNLISFGLASWVWLGFDSFWIFKGGENRRLTDIMAKTYVVNEAARI